MSAACGCAGRAASSTKPEDSEPDAAQDPGRVAVGKPAGDGGDQRDGDRPRGIDTATAVTAMPRPSCCRG
jgi:hypothetical protein